MGLDNLEKQLEDSVVEFISHNNPEGYVQIDVICKISGDGTETIHGTATLYAFYGRVKCDLLNAADSISGDVLYTVTSASSYNPDNSRLFVILDNLRLKDGWQYHFPRIDMLDKIENMLRFFCAPVYFAFMPEAILPNDDIEYQHTTQSLIDCGYQINVGPDREQICLGRLITD